MSNKELDACIKESNRKYKEQMEAMRWQSFIYVSTQTDKIKKPTDLLKFDWDEQEEEQERVVGEELEQRKAVLIEAMQAAQAGKAKIYVP